MSNIFTEVDAALRRDHMVAIWRRYGIFVIIIFIGVLIALAVFTYYTYWRIQQIEAASSEYNQMLATRRNSDDATAKQLLDEFSANHAGGYAALAQFHMANRYAQAGETQAAAAIFTQLATNRNLSVSIRDFARLQSAQTQLEHATLDMIETQLEPLLRLTHPYRPLARETLALALIRAGALSRAREILDLLRKNQEASALVRARAEILFATITSGETLSK